MLTKEKLKNMQPSEIIAHGEFDNNRWIAVRGKTFYDWCIYHDNADNSDDRIINYGKKLADSLKIRQLVPCTNATFDLYRL